MVCVLFSNSAVKVDDPQAYRNVEMTRERIDFNFDQRYAVISSDLPQLCKGCSIMFNL